MSHYLNGRMTNFAGLYGTLLEDKNLSYSVQTGYAGGGACNSGGMNYTALNDTVVLIKAHGAEKVKVEIHQTGVRTDWRGYAMLPNATEYRENRVALDTNTLADNVDLDDPLLSEPPTHGAIVRADFRAYVGMTLLNTHNGRQVC